MNQLLMTLITAGVMFYFFMALNMIIDLITSRKRYVEEKAKRDRYWNSRKRFYLSDTDKANIAKLDTMIAEMKSIKKSIGGI